MELLLLAEPTAEQTYCDLLLKDRNNYVGTTFAKARSYLEQSADEPGIVLRYFNMKFQRYRKDDLTDCPLATSRRDRNGRHTCIGVVFIISCIVLVSTS